MSRISGKLDNNMPVTQTPEPAGSSSPESQQAQPSSHGLKGIAENTRDVFEAPRGRHARDLGQAGATLTVPPVVDDLGKIGRADFTVTWLPVQDDLGKLGRGGNTVTLPPLRDDLRNLGGVSNTVTLPPVQDDLREIGGASNTVTLPPLQDDLNELGAAAGTIDVRVEDDLKKSS